MIPLRDTNHSLSRPYVTTLLVALNVAAFLYEFSLGAGIEHFLREFGVIPVDIVHGRGLALPDRILPLFTSMFLHGGWLHLIGNMLFLWIFGDNVEDRLGHVRFLLFYLMGGLVASTAHILSDTHSTLPTIGASGAVAAVLGAYSYLFPGARVLALVPLGFFLQTMEVPAKIFLGLWFLLQIFSGATTLAVTRGESVGGVAWWAHIGGFLFGFLVVFIFYRERRKRVAPAW
jgi:membrane associated rhomboid family serine protease